MKTSTTRALIVAMALGSAVMAGCASTATQSSAGEVVDDSVITTKIKAKLIEDSVTKAYQISVETFKGTVQLSGFVDSAEARSRAAAIAKEVAGTKNVKNDLKVK